MNTPTREIHWTQFEAAALTGRDGSPVDWTDHAAAHRAVSRLFSPRLSGDAHQRRAGAAILYRVDALNAGPKVLVQSVAAPELVPQGARTMTVPASAWGFEAGERISFRVAVNPVKRTTRRYADTSKRTELLGSARLTSKGPRKSTARVVPIGELLNWVEAKLCPPLEDLEIVSHCREKTRTGAQSLVIDTVDGLASVADPAAFDLLRVQGVGRAKAFGCGLLTAARRPPTLR